MKLNLSVIEKWTRWRRAFLLHFLLFHWLCIMLHFYLFLLSLLCLTSVLISLFFFPRFQINHLWSSFHLYIIIFLIFSLYCILKSCICRSITMCCLATHLISCSLDFSSSLYSCFFSLPPIDHRFAVYPSISQFLVFFFNVWVTLIFTHGCKYKECHKLILKKRGNLAIQSEKMWRIQFATIYFE